MKTAGGRSQKSVRQFLDDKGIEYKSFYISNKILVRKSDLTLIEALASREDISEISMNDSYRLRKPYKNTGTKTYGIESNIAFVRAPEVWNLGYTGSTVILSGNDTGVDISHPAVMNQYRGFDGAVIRP